MLSALILLPLLGAFVIMLCVRDDHERGAMEARYIALFTTCLTFAVSLLAWTGFDEKTADFQFVEKHEWFEGFHIGYAVGIDGISLFMLLLTTFLMPICILCSWESITTRVRAFMASFLILEALVIGVFCALDTVLFYLFFEGMLIPMYLIIGIWGGKQRVYAAYKFFLYTLAGSVLFLIAVVYLYMCFHTTSIPELIKAAPELALPVQRWLWVAMLASFAVKVPMWPVHTWLPDAHVQAPTAGSVILAGILLKMGAYGFLRFSLPMLPAASHVFAPAMYMLSIIAVIYTSLVALVQTDMKKLIAYSSVAHMGFVTIGIFAFNLQGIEGAIMQMISHGLVSGALFLCVGVVYDRMHTREIARYGGVVNVMPKYAAIFLFFTLAAVGLPSTSGFVGEFLVLAGAFKANTWVAFLAATGVVLGAAYMLWLYRRVVFGEAVHEDVKAMADVNRREMIFFVPIVLMVLWLGIYPKPYFTAMEASVTQLIHQVERSDGNRFISGTFLLPPLPRAGEGRGEGVCMSLRKHTLIRRFAPPSPARGRREKGEVMGDITLLALRAILPELYLAAMALFLLMAAAFKCKRVCNSMLGGTLFTLFGAAYFLWPQLSAAPLVAFNGMFSANAFVAFSNIIILAAVGLSVLVAAGWLKEGEGRPSEFLVLMLLSTLGMLLMVAANDLLTLYLALEMSSLSLYVLAAFERDDPKSSEAGLEYFVLGALASGMMLFGMSLVYGFAGTTGFAPLAAVLAKGAMSKGVIVGMILIIIGFCFKMSAVPFHMWTPDVYEGAPTPVTAFFATAPKIAASLLFTRFLLLPFGPMVGQWQQVIAFVAVASMALGALAAIMQTNIKRLLAYSSIGHAGWLMMAMVADDAGGVMAMLVYVALYAFTSLGAFGCVLMMRRDGQYVEDIRELAGLSQRQPALALALAAFMFSLAGIPPLAGFFGKLYVVWAAVGAGYTWLAVIGMVTSVIGAYYYLKIVKIMYLDEPAEPFDAEASCWLRTGIAVAASVTMLFFILPTPLVAEAKFAAEVLLH